VVSCSSRRLRTVLTAARRSDVEGLDRTNLPPAHYGGRYRWVQAIFFSVTILGISIKWRNMSIESSNALFKFIYTLLFGFDQRFFTSIPDDIVLGHDLNVGCITKVGFGSHLDMEVILSSSSRTGQIGSATRDEFPMVDLDFIYASVSQIWQ